jgi:hypothetical protein
MECAIVTHDNSRANGFSQSHHQLKVPTTASFFHSTSTYLHHISNVVIRDSLGRATGASKGRTCAHGLVYTGSASRDEKKRVMLAWMHGTNKNKKQF